MNFEAEKEVMLEHLRNLRADKKALIAKVRALSQGTASVIRVV